MDMLRQCDIRLKINTVVTRSDYDEDLAGFIANARPDRWKLLQVLPVRGQNDGLVDDLVVTHEEFTRYVARNRCVESMGIVVVPESNDLMTGSYVMVDPAGRFFDNVVGTHVYSRPINQVGAFIQRFPLEREPKSTLLTTVTLTVYPRPRGGTNWINARQSTPQGLSPPTQGNL